jgi:ketosteroid isomerase-like protein
MYHLIVRHLARTSFVRLGQGDYEFALKLCADDVTHTFRGPPNAITGTRRGKARLRAWFQRVTTVFRGLHFEIKMVTSSGWPWNTVAIVEWADRAIPADGEPYINEGVNIIRMRWGKVKEIIAYNDTAAVERTMQRLASANVAEAGLPPIEGSDSVGSG